MKQNHGLIDIMFCLDIARNGSHSTLLYREGYWETTKSGKHWRAPGYIGFRSANNFHRVDLKPGTKPMTIFIPGPFGLRKGPRSEYGIDFKTKIK